MILLKDNCEIFYETNGESGPWLTLVNGHTRSSKDFRMMTKNLVHAGYRVLTCDNRGSGETISPSSFNLNDMVSDVLSIWDHCNIEKSHLLGISMGGMISQMIASTYPQRIGKLCLISTTTSLQYQTDEKGWGDTLEEIEDKMKEYFAPSFLVKNKLLVQAMSKQILQQVKNGVYIENAKKQRDAISNFKLSNDELSLIESETLILHGVDDLIISVEEAYKIEEGIKNSHVKIFPGVGHLLIAEIPKQLYSTIIDYFG